MVFFRGSSEEKDVDDTVFTSKIPYTGNNVREASCSFVCGLFLIRDPPNQKYFGCSRCSTSDFNRHFRSTHPDPAEIGISRFFDFAPKTRFFASRDAFFITFFHKNRQKYFFLNMFPTCSERVPNMFGTSSERVRVVSGPCSEHVQDMFGPCSEHVQMMFGSCFEHVRIMFRTYSRAAQPSILFALIL